KKHLGLVERFSNFAITASIFFKQLKPIIIINYFLLNDMDYKREVQQEIIRKYIDREQNTKFIFIRDFNIMVDNKKATEKQKRINKGKTLPIVSWFGRQEDALDSIWEILEKSILKTVIKHIPKKKICKTRVTRNSKKRSRLDKLIVELGRWVKKDKRKIEKEKIRQLKRCIERQCQIIDREQGRIIVSLLEKPFNHAVVNKLLKNQNNTRVLVYELEQVKEKTKEFFK
ncbi:42714_t:CDS:2, partial [Gigaspora margarita]